MYHVVEKCEKQGWCYREANEADLDVKLCSLDFTLPFAPDFNRRIDAISRDGSPHALICWNRQRITASRVLPDQHSCVLGGNAAEGDALQCAQVGISVFLTVLCLLRDHLLYHLAWKGYIQPQIEL